MLRTWVSDREAETIVICDGGYKPENGAGGLAVYGCLVWHRYRLIHRESGVVCRGRSANSKMAELGAVVAALRWLDGSPNAAGSRVEIRSDCRWVVDGLSGTTIHPIHGTAQLSRTANRLLSRLHQTGCQISISYAPRHMVADADAMCRGIYLTQQPRTPLPEFLRLKPRPAVFVQSGR